MIYDAPCPRCEDGKIWRSVNGGNDPDVWAVTCDLCDGTGVIEHDLNEECDDD